MAEKRRTPIEEIREWIPKLQPMIDLTGMKRNFLLVHTDAHLFPEKMIKDGLDWIRDIGLIYIECIKIRRQCTEEQWAGYKIMSGLDTDELTEVVQMNKALAKLRTALVSKTRPDFFKREAQRVEAKRIKIKKSKIKKT